MAGVKGLGKLRAELNRFHEELSRINASPFPAAEDEISQARDLDSPDQEDDAVWDSIDVKSSGSRVQVRKGYEVRSDQPSSQDYKYGLKSAAGRSLSRSFVREEMQAYKGFLPSTEDGSSGSAGKHPSGDQRWKEDNIKANYNSPSDAGCGEANCRAAVWNGRKECECHLDKAVRISASASFTANLGQVVATESGSSPRISELGGNDELKALQNRASGGSPLMPEIAVQLPLGNRAELAQDIASHNTSHGKNTFTSHQISCHDSGGMEVFSKSSIRTVGHAIIGGAVAASAAGSLNVRLATSIGKTTSSFTTNEVAIVQHTNFVSGQITDHSAEGMWRTRAHGSPMKHPQIRDGLDQSSSQNPPFLSHWDWKVPSSQPGKEDVLAAKMAAKVKHALEGLGTQGTKVQRGYLGLGISSRVASERVNKGRDPSSSSKSVGAQDPADMNAESYLQEILAALSPEKSPEQEKVRQLSTSSDTAGKRTAAELESRQDNLGQELDSNRDGACNGGECRCPFEEPDVNPPSKRASLCGWTSSPKQAPSGHYTTVLEIPQGAPISISYSTEDKIKPENQENVTFHVTCNPEHVEPATNKCAVQLCPLEACPAGCDDAQCFPDPPETISVRDPTEKRFEDATRLLYNLDGKRGRNRGKCTLPRDCHWNCDRLSRQLQRPQRKAVPQQTKCNPKAQVQPKSSACHLKKEPLECKSHARPKAHGTSSKRITAAADLVQEIENLMASDRNDIMEDEMPFKYTRLDAPVNAAAQAVCKLTREPPPSEVDPSKWRQLFAAQMGRTAHAQEAVKKLVGGGIDYDQLHKELNDISKERQRIIKSKQHPSKMIFTTNNVGKCWQEPCLLPGYQGEERDELFLNSLRQEVESRIASHPRNKRRKVVHSPLERSTKQLQQQLYGDGTLAGYPRAAHFQPPAYTRRSDTLEDLLVEKRPVAQPSSSGTSKKLQNLVKEVENMMKRRTGAVLASEPKVVSKGGGQSPQRDHPVPQWLPHMPVAQWQVQNHKVDPEEHGAAGSKHFVRAALRRKEVRPPELLFKSGVPTKWTVHVDPASNPFAAAGFNAQPTLMTTPKKKQPHGQQHPQPKSPHGHHEYNNHELDQNLLRDVQLMNQRHSPGSKQTKLPPTGRKGPPTKPGGVASSKRLVVSAAKAKSGAVRKSGRERKDRTKPRRNIAGPVIDFDYPFERDRNLWPVPRAKGVVAEKPKAKKKYDVGPVIDFDYEFERDRNLWPVVHKQKKAEKQRSRLEAEWRRLDKDRRLFEVYGARLTRKRFGGGGSRAGGASHDLGSVADSLLRHRDDDDGGSSLGSKSNNNGYGTPKSILPPPAAHHHHRQADSKKKAFQRRLEGPRAPSSIGKHDGKKTTSPTGPGAAAAAGFAGKSPRSGHATSSGEDDHHLHHLRGGGHTAAADRVPRGGHFDHLGSYHRAMMHNSSKASTPPHFSSGASERSKSSGGASSQQRDKQVRDAHSAAFHESARATRKAIDGLLDTLTSEALHKEISALSTSAEDVVSGGGGGGGSRRAAGAGAAKESSEEHKYDTDEFCSDSDEPAAGPGGLGGAHVQQQQLAVGKHPSKGLPRELKQEQEELTAEVLQQALKEIVLQNVLSDQQRRLDRYVEDEREVLDHPEPRRAPPPPAAFDATTVPSSSHHKPGDHDSTKNHQVSFAWVQTPPREHRYAESQTPEHPRSSVESQTPAYQHRYAESQTHSREQRYAGVQTAEKEVRFAGVQTEDEHLGLGGGVTTHSSRRAAAAAAAAALAGSTPSTGRTQYYTPPEYRVEEEEEDPGADGSSESSVMGQQQQAAGTRRGGKAQGVRRPHFSDSPPTPSTPSSDPEHEARVAAVLARYPGPAAPHDETTTTTSTVSSSSSKHATAAPPAAHSEASATTSKEVTVHDDDAPPPPPPPPPVPADSAAARPNVTLHSTYTVRFQTPTAASPPAAHGHGHHEDGVGKSSRSESGVQARPPTATTVTQTDEAAAAEDVKPSADSEERHLSHRPRHLRRVDETESMAFGMIAKAVRGGSSADVSSSESESYVPSVADPSAILSPGEVEGSVSTEGAHRLAPRVHAAVDQDIRTKYFKLKQYSAKEAEKLMQERHNPASMSEGETDVGALWDFEEPGQAHHSGHEDKPGGGGGGGGGGKRGEAGEVAWGNGGMDSPMSPGETHILSEGEVDPRHAGEVY